MGALQRRVPSASANAKSSFSSVPAMTAPSSSSGFIVVHSRGVVCSQRIFFVVRSTAISFAGLPRAMVIMRGGETTSVP